MSISVVFIAIPMCHRRLVWLIPLHPKCKNVPSWAVKIEHRGTASSESMFKSGECEIEGLPMPALLFQESEGKSCRRTWVKNRNQIHWAQELKESWRATRTGQKTNRPWKVHETNIDDWLQNLQPALLQAAPCSVASAEKIHWAFSYSQQRWVLISRPGHELMHRTPKPDGWLETNKVPTWCLSQRELVSTLCACGVISLCSLLTPYILLLATWASFAKKWSSDPETWTCVTLGMEPWNLEPCIIWFCNIKPLPSRSRLAASLGRGTFRTWTLAIWTFAPLEELLKLLTALQP